MACRKELFPFNGKINGKSSYPLPGRDKNPRFIDIINIDEVTKKNLVSEYIKPKHREILFFHGTSSENSKAIVNSGIDVAKARKGCDFGPGFYVSEDFNYARDYVKQVSKEYTVLVFKLTPTFWEDQRNFGYDFDREPDENKSWEDYVAYNRSRVEGGRLDRKSNIKPLLTQLESKAFIRGHVCAKNLKKSPVASSQTIAKDPVVQLCIKTNEWAERFFSFLCAAFSYNETLY